MGYSIEFKKKAYYFDPEPGLTERNFLAYHLCADNNVFPRTPKPRLIDFGWNYQIIQEVCKLAGYCEGGTIKPNNRNTSPEAYIKAWRKVLAEAQPFSEFRKEFPTAALKVAVEPEKLKELIDKVSNDPACKYSAEVIMKAINAEKAYSIFFVGKKIIEFIFPIDEANSIAEYNTLVWILKKYDSVYYTGMIEKLNAPIGDKYSMTV